MLKCVVSILCLWMVIQPAQAQSHGGFARADVWDVKLGTSLSELPRGFADFACGADGGPPRQELDDASEFKRCAAELSGLREVSFRYDDELEYIARARGDEALAARYAGTRVLLHPAILSLLISDEGVIEGIRIVSDPRAEVEVRQMAYLLGEHLMGRFGRDLFSCVDLPRGEREEPFGTIFVKQSCAATVDGVRLTMENRFLLKAGQTLLNPHTREVQRGYFDSSTRFQMIRAPL